jgi:hypothetical protein
MKSFLCGIHYLLILKEMLDEDDLEDLQYDENYVLQEKGVNNEKKQFEEE